MTEFTLYQSIRQRIPECKTFQEFHPYLDGVNKNSVIGLFREWRAYWYLVKRFPKWQISMSVQAQDISGVDILMLTGPQDNPNVKLVQVGGNMIQDKRKQVDYYMQVTNNKCYLWKGGKDVN